MKKKTLRQTYMANPEARKFLEEHPEFDDRFIEQVDAYHPGFNTSIGSYSLTELSEEKREYGDLLADAFNSLPENHRRKALLEDYFKGIPLKELQLKYEYKTNASLREAIRFAKKLAINNLIKSQQIKLKNYTKVAERTISYNGATETLYLIFSEQARDFVWVTSGGKILPNSVQRILDEDPDFKEWDHIFLIDSSEK